jgi:glyoxylase-like metal-dependent hydrolase (beta-lactamase superfamily II)
MTLKPALAVLLVSTSAALLAQPAPGALDSYTRARRLVDQAVAAHGGLDALRSARQIRVVREGYDVWRHQSRAVKPPFDRERFTSDMHIDLENGRLIAEERRTYPGGAHRHFSFVTDRKQSYYVNHQRRLYFADDYPPAETQTGNLHGLPQLVLLAAHESDLRLRALGPMTLASGARVEAITTTAGGNTLTLGLDPDTHLLRAVIAVRNDAVDGVAATETEFLSYTMREGLLMPERRVNWVAGAITQDTTFTTVVRNYRAADGLVRPPAGYDNVPLVDTPVVRELATGVWLVGGDSAALVVAMDDHLIVVDAAPAIAGRVTTEAARLAPGKPIRYVVPTHHHDDHAPGVRTLAANGATILTTAGNTVMFERMSKAPIDVVTGSRVLSSGNRTVALHDIGPSPHANEMLVAWLPAEGILFQADLIDVGADGVIRPGTNNETTMHLAQWLAGKQWKPRLYAGAHGGTLDAARFTQLIAQSVRRPN